jgi:purine-binding chemotaxis protein CheW
VTFLLGEDHFAAEISAVERILRYEQPVSVPNLPEWVEGVLEYEGRVVPVVDLRRRFGLDGSAARANGNGRVIVFNVGAEWIGGVVDSVLEVTTIPATQVAAPPSLFRGLSADFLRGLVRREGKLVIFLDVEKLLTATERLRLERGFGDGGRDA